MAKVFEEALRELFASGERSVERLFSLYQRHMDVVLQVIVETTNMHLRRNHENNPELFLKPYERRPHRKRPRRLRP